MFVTFIVLIMKPQIVRVMNKKDQARQCINKNTKRTKENKENHNSQ